MILRPRLLAAALVIGVVVTSCGEPREDRVPGPDLQEEANPEIVVTMSVDDNGFDPDEITLTAGEGIELTNEGSDSHSFDTADDYHTGLLLPGESTTLVFDEPGEYAVTDAANPDATATVTVEEAPEDDG